MGEIKKVLLKDFKENNEKCPHCGNKIFWEYGGAAKGQDGSSLRCTFCSRDYDFNGVDAFEEVDFTKNKVPQFFKYHKQDVNLV